MPKKFGNKNRPAQVNDSSLVRFEEVLLPHLNAAYNYARWLTLNEHDAEDVAQESYLRALKSFDTFKAGHDGRAWLLTIVRNTCYTWLRKNRPGEIMKALPDEALDTSPGVLDPEHALIKSADAKLIREAVESLPVEYREVLMLRELEELSYKEIAQLTELPLGTVMSRLSRARSILRDRLTAEPREVKK